MRFAAFAQPSALAFAAGTERTIFQMPGDRFVGGEGRASRGDEDRKGATGSAVFALPPALSFTARTQQAGFQMPEDRFVDGVKYEPLEETKAEKEGQ